MGKYKWNEDVADEKRKAYIEKVAKLVTHNAFSKDDLVDLLREYIRITNKGGENEKD